VDGGNCSDMKKNTSKTLRTTNVLMYLETKILKDKMFKYGTDTMASTRDGQFFMIRMRKMRRQKEWESMDSRLMNHSSSFQECQ